MSGHTVDRVHRIDEGVHVDFHLGRDFKSRGNGLSLLRKLDVGRKGHVQLPV